MLKPTIGKLKNHIFKNKFLATEALTPGQELHFKLTNTIKINLRIGFGIGLEWNNVVILH